MSIISYINPKKIFIIVSLLVGSSANAALMTDQTYFQFDTETLLDNQVNDDVRTTLKRTQKHTLSGFDSSLGVLTSVTFSFNTDWEMLSKVVATDKRDDYLSDVAQGKSVATSRMVVNLIDPNALSPQKEFDREVAKCRDQADTTPVQCKDKQDDDGTFEGEYSWVDSTINDFIDQDITLKLTQNLTVEAFSNDFDSKVKAFNKNNFWGGYISIEYEYEAFDVPEPSTILLLLMGVTAVGIRRNRYARVKTL